ncbi:hypothetical protein [Streptomyces sp. IBSBF 2435]|uniref:hypothetical protein n=1 Tax=Streptomyces sp. IBSBF 2435 TaxID=2903531 RepID=UPI002FDBED43
MATTGTGRGAVTDAHTGWHCTNGASLLARITGPGLGRLPAEHGVIYVCADHQVQAEARITTAGHQPATDPAPPGHRHDPWPCGHITTHGETGPHLADALTTPVTVHFVRTVPSPETITAALTGLIPRALPDHMTAVLIETAPDGARHTWNGSLAGLAQRIHTAISHTTER